MPLCRSGPPTCRRALPTCRFTLLAITGCMSTWCRSPPRCRVRPAAFWLVPAARRVLLRSYRISLTPGWSALPRIPPPLAAHWKKVALGPVGMSGRLAVRPGRTTGSAPWMFRRFEPYAGEPHAESYRPLILITRPERFRSTPAWQGVMTARLALDEALVTNAGSPRRVDMLIQGPPGDALPHVGQRAAARGAGDASARDSAAGSPEHRSGSSTLFVYSHTDACKRILRTLRSTPRSRRLGFRQLPAKAPQLRDVITRHPAYAFARPARCERSQHANAHVPQPRL